MKLNLKLGSMAIAALCASAAYADQIGLTYLNTTNLSYCEQVASEVNLLSTPNAQVSATCEAGVVSSRPYTVVTTITTDFSVIPGMSIPLANLDVGSSVGDTYLLNQYETDLGYLTNTPSANSGRYPLVLNAEGPSSFVSDQGYSYVYRLQVSVSVN